MRAAGTGDVQPYTRPDRIATRWRTGECEVTSTAPAAGDARGGT